MYSSFTLIDCGAYTGDSLEDFHLQCGKKLRQVYLLEADESKQIALQNTVKKLGMEHNAVIIMQGASDQAGNYFIENAGTTSGKVSSAGEIPTQTLRLDDISIHAHGKLCIKMDIEGLEIQAFRGAAETIKKYQPEIAVCIYHKAADIYEIPSLIKKICPQYQFIIRGGVHTVCYCSTSRF